MDTRLGWDVMELNRVLLSFTYSPSSDDTIGQNIMNVW